jgi:YD repeat-containing protein
MVTQIERSSNQTGGLSSTKGLVYDSSGRLLEETETDVKKQVYAYNANGDRTAHDEYTGTGFTTYQDGELYGNYDPARSEPYDYDGYDSKNRLKYINHYHANGTHTTPTENPTANDQESFTGASDFDANGNQLKSIKGKQYTFSYYPDNRLQSITGPSSFSETSSYDGAGRLSSRTQAGGAMTFGYDGTTCLTDTLNGSVSEERVPLAAGSVRVRYLSTGPVVEYVHYDPLGNAAVVTNASGSRM